MGITKQDPTWQDPRTHVGAPSVGRGSGRTSQNVGHPKLLVVGVLKPIPLMRTWVLRVCFPIRFADAPDYGLAAWLWHKPRDLWRHMRDWARERGVR